MATIVTETDRLRLRHFTTEDAPFVLQLLNTPGWLHYIGDRHVYDLASAKKYIEMRMLQHYATHGYGMWLVERQEDNAALGACGLVKRDFLEAADLGFAFLPDFFGQGYAAEAARASLAHGFTTLNHPEILAFTLPENEASKNLLEKVGMTFVKVFQMPEETDTLWLYRTAHATE